MGERRARIKYYGAKAKPIAEYTKIYLSALRALINSVALNELYVKIPNIAILGPAEGTCKGDVIPYLISVWIRLEFNDNYPKVEYSQFGSLEDTDIILNELACYELNPKKL